MSIEAWITLGLLAVMLAGLATNRVGADLIVMGTVALMLLVDFVFRLDLLEPADALAGFASPGPATVGLLYVVAAGLRETGALTFLTERMLGSPKSALAAQARLALPVAASSAFINNTPIVTVFLPVLSSLCKRTGIAPGQVFMPLSAAAILGGLCTLIGTSTNLVMDALIADHNAAFPDAQQIERFGMFGLTRIGLPAAIIGLAFILLFGRRLLPGSRTAEPVADAAREFATTMRVMPGSALAGKTIEQAGLRRLPGLFLSRIDRQHQAMLAVSPDEQLAENDLLMFVGDIESVVDLQKLKGLVPAADEDDHTVYRPHLRLIEAVVSPEAAVIGQSIRDSGFRARYGAVIVAVHRQGHRLVGRLGDIVLRAGDRLLFEADPDFAMRHRETTDFYLLSALKGSAAPRHDRAWMAIALLAGLVLSVPVLGMPPLIAALTAACGMVLLRCCTGRQARKSVDWSVLIVIGGASALGHAVETSGLGELVATRGIGWAAPLGIWGVCAVLYAMTSLATATINNIAAAVLMFPIALSAASLFGFDPMPLLVCVTLAASAEFMSPIGYQTNLIVMGPGGYKVTDYLRFGVPLTLLVGVVVVALAPLLY